jgi:hypothetical protein
MAEPRLLQMWARAEVSAKAAMPPRVSEAGGTQSARCQTRFGDLPASLKRVPTSAAGNGLGMALILTLE